MALQVCDLAYRSSQCPALRVNQLSISFTSLESYHCLRKAPNCGGYLCVVFDSPPEWGLWSWSSFCFPDWLPTPFFTEPAQNKVHTPQTYNRLTWCFLCVSVTSPSFSSGFQISKKDVPSFLRLTSPLVFWVIFPSHVLLALTPPAICILTPPPLWRLCLFI